jgi:hypothetical protein
MAARRALYPTSPILRAIADRLYAPKRQVLDTVLHDAGVLAVPLKAAIEAEGWPTPEEARRDLVLRTLRANGGLEEITLSPLKGPIADPGWFWSAEAAARIASMGIPGWNRLATWMVHATDDRRVDPVGKVVRSLTLQVRIGGESVEEPPSEVPGTRAPLFHIGGGGRFTGAPVVPPTTPPSGPPPGPPKPWPSGAITPPTQDGATTMLAVVLGLVAAAGAVAAIRS